MLYNASHKSSDNSELAKLQPQNSLLWSSNSCGCFTLRSSGIVTRRFIIRLLKHLLLLYFASVKFLDNSKLAPLQPENSPFRLKQFWLWTFRFAKNCYPRILKVAQYSNYLFDKKHIFGILKIRNLKDRK